MTRAKNRKLELRRKAQQILSLALLAPLAVLSMACGRETKVYPDQTAPAATVSAEPTPNTDGRTSLPVNLYDQSANLAQVDLALDGVTATSKALRFETAPGTSPEGTYNGHGTGNAAILGIGGHHGEKLADLGAITFDVKSYNGTSGFTVALNVDLGCAGKAADKKVLFVEPSALGGGDPQSAGYTRLHVAKEEAKWKVMGNDPVLDPTDNTTVLVHEAASATYADLTTLMTKYPNACLKVSASTADPLPQGLVLGSVLLMLGNDTTVTMNGAYVNRITIGSQIIDEME